MTETDSPGPSAATVKMKRLAIGIVIFILAYTAVWFLAAHQIETRLTAWLDGRSSTGSTAQCSGMDVRGYPFRIGLFCDTLTLSDDDVRASFGALRSAAQVYQPGHAVLELDGPADVRLAPGITVSADWSLLHASLQATLSSLLRTSITYDGLAGTLQMEPSAPKFAFTAAHGEVHLRQNGPDLDAAFSVAALDIKPENGNTLLPALTASIDLTLAERATLLNTGGFAQNALHNVKGEMRAAMFDLGSGMRAKASGPFRIDARGLISGEFSVTMANIEGWRQALAKAFPDEDSLVLVNNVANMLTALADGKNEATVKLNFRDGIAFLAFFPLGELPHF